MVVVLVVVGVVFVVVSSSVCKIFNCQQDILTKSILGRYATLKCRV